MTMSKEMAFVALACLIGLVSVASADYYVDWSDLNGNYEIIGTSNTSSSTPTFYNRVSAYDNLWFYSDWVVAPSFRSYGPPSDDCPEFSMTASNVLDSGKSYEIYIIASLGDPGNLDWDGAQAAISGDSLINITQSNSVEFSQSADAGAITMWKSSLGTVTGVTSVSVDLNDNGIGDGGAVNYSQIVGVAWTEVPEPATIALLGSGMLLSLIRRKKR